MKTMHVLLSLGLLCGAMAVAQDSAGGQMTNPNDRTSAGANALRGCLSGADGNYILTLDDTGTVLQLVGKDTKFRKFVGQQVSITGKALENMGTPATDGSTTQNQNQDQMQSQAQSSPAGTASYKVSTVETISKHCK